MITGNVIGTMPVVRLTVYGPSGRRDQVDFIVDTGFDGDLSLPAATISRLGLAWNSNNPILLADGTEVRPHRYEAEVAWDGAVVRVWVIEFDSLPLLGTYLMGGHKLEIDMRDGGAVSITRLP